MYFHYRVTFTGYIRCFCATTSHDLDLLTLRVSHVQCFSCPTHIPIFIILRLSFTELRLLNIWSHLHYLKQSLRMRRVTWPPTGGKNSPHFWNPWPQFTYSLCHFQGATTKIKPCYMRKIAFIPLWRLQSSLRMRSITWHVHRGSPKPHVTIFWPRLIYSLYNLYGATTTPKRHFLTRNDVIWRILCKYSF